jgi:hypothetical protein
MVRTDSPFAENPEAAWPNDNPKEAGVIRLHYSLVPPQFVDKKTLDAMTALPGPMSISFRNSQGLRWIRLPNGELVEVGRTKPSPRDRLVAWSDRQLDELDRH